MKTGNHFGIRDLAGASFQDLLSAAGDREQTAFSGTFGFEIIILKLRCKSSGKKILQSNARAVFLVVVCRKSSYLMRNLHMQAGRRGERIALYMINKQIKIRKLITARKRFVGRITSMIDGAQGSAQLIG